MIEAKRYVIGHGHPDFSLSRQQVTKTDDDDKQPLPPDRTGDGGGEGEKTPPKKQTETDDEMAKIFRDTKDMTDEERMDYLRKHLPGS